MRELCEAKETDFTMPEKVFTNVNYYKLSFSYLSYFLNILRILLHFCLHFVILTLYTIRNANDILFLFVQSREAAETVGTWCLDTPFLDFGLLRYRITS